MRLLKEGSTNLKRNVIFILLVVLCTVATYFLLPADSVMDKYYTVGKPWSYDAVIAPADFPVFKSETDFRAERDSVERNLVPLLDYDSAIVYRTLRPLISASDSDSFALSLLVSSLNEVYSVGIISADEKKRLEHLSSSCVTIVSPDMSASQRLLADLYTPVSAYEYIIALFKGENIPQTDINALNIASYLVPSLTLNVSKTEAERQRLLNSVLPTEGMVQKGERIIDQGEIVTPEIDNVLRSLRRVSREDQLSIGSPLWSALGDLLLILFFYGLISLYLILFRKRILSSTVLTFYIYKSVFLMTALMAFTVRFLGFSEYTVPVALVPILVSTFCDSRTSLYTHIITVLLCSLFVSNPTEFIIVQIIIGMVTVSSMKDITSRYQLLRTVFFIFISYIIAIIAIRLSVGVSPSEFNWWFIGLFLFNSILLFVSYILIYVEEKIFGFLSNVTLVELSNLNSKLLTEFSSKCAGSLSHSINVAHLASSAAKAVDANPPLAYAGGLYHDIGKMANPGAYTENQIDKSNNPLLAMQPIEAARTLQAHVSEGVQIAKRNHLPNQIIEFIVTHHGTTFSGQFYMLYRRGLESEPVENPIPESEFRYNGHRPESKETLIVMLADSVEAATASLANPTTDQITELVDKIIRSKFDDHQFDDAKVTFQDIAIIRRTLIDELVAIRHSRIQYIDLSDESHKHISFPRRFRKR